MRLALFIAVSTLANLSFAEIKTGGFYGKAVTGQNKAVDAYVWIQAAPTEEGLQDWAYAFVVLGKADEAEGALFRVEEAGDGSQSWIPGYQNEGVIDVFEKYPSAYRAQVINNKLLVGGSPDQKNCFEKIQKMDLAPAGKRESYSWSNPKHSKYRYKNERIELANAQNASGTLVSGAEVRGNVSLYMAPPIKGTMGLYTLREKVNNNLAVLGFSVARDFYGLAVFTEAPGGWGSSKQRLNVMKMESGKQKCFYPITRYTGE